MRNPNAEPENLSTALAREAERVLRDAGLTAAGLLVGVSGGVDSVALVRVLHRVTAAAGGRLEVAHVDHGLRPGSGRDAAFCRALAGELGLPFHLYRVPEGQLAGGNLQARARLVRRGFFEAVLEEQGLDAIALGHHADDQVETVLLRLVRGAGPRGLGGMAPYEPPYVRPLLGVRRSAIEKAAEQEGWAFREDPTNRSDRYARNRVRRWLLAELRSVHPGADEAILRAAALLREDDRCLSEAARAALDAVAVPEPEGLRLPVELLGGWDAAVRRRIYLAAWTACGGDAARLSAGHLAAVDALLGPGRAHRTAPVPGPWAFVRSYEDLWCLAPDRTPPGFGARLDGPGREPLGDGRVLAWGETPPAGAAAVAVPPGTRRVWGRSRKPGDRVGGTKVKDLLMDARVPRWRRDRAVVVGTDAGPFALLLGGRAWGGEGAGCGWSWLETVPGAGDRNKTTGFGLQRRIRPGVR